MNNLTTVNTLTTNGHSTKTNVRTCHCVVCHRVLSIGEGIGTITAQDTKIRYICSWCNTNVHYHAQPSAPVGNTRTKFTYGAEFEMNNADDVVRTTLKKFGWALTNDSSLSGSRTVEAVSPLNKGLMALTKQLKSLGEMKANGQWTNEDNNSCGTHLHIGYGDMSPYMSGIRRNAKNLFGKAEKLMLDNPTKTKEFFGRNFDNENVGMWNSYSHYYESGVCRANSSSRYHWVNLTLSNHLEFRINKFITTEQYMNLIHLEEKWTKTIVEGLDKGWKYEKIGTKLAKLLEKAWA